MSLPALPGLKRLSCSGCPRLAFLPALPASLKQLYYSDWTALPDAYPSTLTRVNDAPVDRRVWRQQVTKQHARQRAAVAAVLPPLALLYV